MTLVQAQELFCSSCAFPIAQPFNTTMLPLMKKLICYSAFAFALAISFSSCTSDTDTITVTSGTEFSSGKARLKLVCTANVGSSTRAALTANGTALTDLYILDYDKNTGTLLQVLHQTSDAADFAEPNITLDYGEHTLKVFATRSLAPTLLAADGTTWTSTANTLTAVSGNIPTTLASSKTSDTFGACQNVSVTVGTASTVSVTLERLVAKLVLNSTDDFPTACSTIDAKLNEYAAFSCKDFNVISLAKNHRIADVSSLAGQHGMTFTYFFLAPQEEYTTDITFTTNSATGSPYSRITVENVPLERNKITTITGSLYNHEQGFSVSLNDAWNTETNDINI